MYKNSEVALYLHLYLWERYVYNGFECYMKNECLQSTDETSRPNNGELYMEMEVLPANPSSVIIADVIDSIKVLREDWIESNDVRTRKRIMVVLESDDDFRQVMNDWFMSDTWVNGYLPHLSYKENMIRTIVAMAEKRVKKTV